ncbi:M50 family metallopeptidase [Nocardioides sp. AE5]|uniref:M50 family metallopeptidase n=1 Tax=Nocardioides sp. AE5 TaxID=2962573 RepID=UPI0028828CEA|nr:M50 family metallopeptidase [Nocardioides sp. AE5]MDT0203405.1 M50 family metallopeptidase [Nocardioides sp. AE5]
MRAELAQHWPAGVALLLVVLPLTWHWTRHLVTVVHEGGHAFVALLVGRRLSGIRLHSDTSGLTVSRGRPRGPGMVAMLLAGYLAPSAAGVAAAAVLAAGRPVTLLWAMVVVLVLMLVQIRNWYGALVLLVIGGGAGAAAWYLPDAVVADVAAVLTWTLLLAAPRPVLELARGPRRERRGSDADQLARLTPLPAWAWIGFFAVATLTALGFGVRLLVPEAF